MRLEILPPLTELDAWLAAREASVPGLRPECAAGVVWGPAGPGTKAPLSIVYLPGYTATRGEIAPVADRLAQSLGAHLYYARLTGHGTGFDGHRTCKLSDWKRDGAQAWAIGQALGERVILMGTSTGGTLATWLVLGPRKVRPAATVLVSPNFGPKDRMSEFLLWPGRPLILRAVLGDRVGFAPVSEAHGLYWDYDHHSHSLIPMMDLVAQARRGNFRRWPTPVQVVVNPADSVVEQRITEQRFARCPAATVEPWVPAAGDHDHVLAGDILSPGGTDRMVELVGGWLKANL